ncbi:hypothetical protein COCC4DRAFT_71814 [Bipolaris maydis ATCC 48331]|uniref:Uncharacterized protein n=2 Tax=Cochliobolus heterostrophus TaxID=5016 RepID=M2ULT5_COCH5|nr:uncharacterized protein COCC4DRAFT_71814 [Bipolaris maydis ATCC 48331]EMD88882.1 hypothetical protein COCHEDRAFT_1142958 [Bipolaris maydis C5]KAJ5028548.1 hypothetical protein J3E73DRAFT_421806 [Bipolaris maydis]ENI05402.1 hypothetical protein COCC4DRAFT_71814 [Bipolaris maydis ATCC 48331]KAJ5063327.1 hypothetical protein J3E74DRAFT_264263 [Bipolaris maydis]KAJ6199592.1 hypothetical protein J3E72DRAFT_237789 [Bipolaris maydis]
MPGAISNDTPTTASAERIWGIYHITHPRSASNLFQNMMGQQPGFQYLSYKLFGAGFEALTQLQRGPLGELPKEDREKLFGLFEAGFEGMHEEIEGVVAGGKKVFMKEHAVFLSAADKLIGRIHKNDNVAPLIVHERGVAPSKSSHTNPTSLPDSFLLKFQPIFQIRNPVLMFPSLVRAQMDVKVSGRPGDPVGQVMLQLRDSRTLYDWYAAQTANTGITRRIIDADDVMNDAASMRKLCLETGLDPNAIVFEWEERTVEDPVQARFFSTLAKSKGIVKGLDANGKSVEGEMEKWVEEFGRENAEELARLVERAMGDYEYLHSKRTVAGEKE